MTRLHATRTDLDALARALDDARPQLLEAWRDHVAADPSLDAASDWSLRQFNDHFPDVLTVLSQALRSWPELPPALLDREQGHAIAHARARWVQGYSLRGVVREWGHFNAVVVDRLAAFAVRSGDPAIVRLALGVWARIFNDQQSISALEYHQLERSEAETRGAELRRALDALRSGTLDRGRAMQALASTMRNDLQVVMTSNSLGREEGRWHEAYELRKLSRDGFRSLEQALSDMVTLAGLEAGHEVRQVEPFDAGAGFVLLVEGLQHVAAEAGASLQGAGPEHFIVHGDAERVRRLARHLLACVLRAPRPGSVAVQWGAHPDTPARWRFSVEHAALPLPASGSSASGHALAVATEAVREVEGIVPTSDEAALVDGRIPVAAGDGVDLLIARHLADLLGGRLEIEADHGALCYRVSLPTGYAGR